eukprot:6422098-Amphidinium_carterae.1
MPWEDILQSLQQVVELGQDKKSVDLPHTGSDLVELVRVILKTNKQAMTTEDEIKTLIHQANVRRE